MRREFWQQFEAKANTADDVFQLTIALFPLTKNDEIAIGCDHHLVDETIDVLTVVESRELEGHLVTRL